jgi:hypothetical protein
MAEKENAKNWLLTNVPEDIRQIVSDYKTKKKKDCGCRFGNSQAIYNLLRKVNAKENA